jgi:hypothetical protein
MKAARSTLVTIFCCVFSILSFAQKNEVSLSVGAMHSSDQTETLTGIVCILELTCSPLNTSTSNGVAFEGSYARQLFSFGGTSLDFELPLVGVPERDVKVANAGITLPGSLSTWTLFLTPSARIKLFQAGPISPFASVGGGWAHFGTSFNFSGITIGGVPVPGTAFSFSHGTNNGALQFGGGADFRTPLTLLAIRAEVRDFWAIGIAEPSSGVRVSPEHQHNIFAGGGVVLRF